MSVWNETPCAIAPEVEVVVLDKPHICCNCRRIIPAGNEATTCRGTAIGLGLIARETPAEVEAFTHHPSCPVLGPKLVPTGKTVRCALCNEQIEKGVMACQDGRVWLHFDCLERLKAIVADHDGLQLLQARGDETCAGCEKKLKKGQLVFKAGEGWYHPTCLEEDEEEEGRKPRSSFIYY